MSEATFYYKCKKCGEVYSEGHTSIDNARFYLMRAVFGLALPFPHTIGIKPELVNIHHCPDPEEGGGGGQGVAELLGWE